MFDFPGTTIAYPFKSSELDDKELGVSILSMLRFFVSGNLNVLIVGDKPKCKLPSWAVHVPHKAGGEPLRDAIRKLEAINAVAPPGKFIYCHDDIFALRPFALERLENSVLYTHYRNYVDWTPHNKWAAAKKHSMRLINIDEAFDSATHMPRVFETDLVAEVLNRFSKTKELWDFQIVYDNLFTPRTRFVKTVEDQTFLRFEHNKMTYDKMKSLAETKIFCNTGSQAFTPDVEKFLYDNAANYEQIKPPSPPPPAKRTLPIYERCRHRGPETGESVYCGTCPSLTKQKPIFYCAKHGVCTQQIAKKPNLVYGRPINCVECLAEDKGFEAKTDVHNQKFQDPSGILASPPSSRS